MSLVKPPDVVVRASLSEEDIASLAWSMAAVGLIEPIVVKKCDAGFEIVAGHRRFLAAEKLGWTEISAIEHDASAESDPEALKLHENLYRAEVTALEEAVYFAELIDRGADIEKLAAIVRHPPSYVQARLKILELKPTILQALSGKKINLSVAMALNRCESESGLTVLLHHAVHDGATARMVQEWVSNQNYLDGFAEQPNFRGLAPETQADIEVERMWHCYLCGLDVDRALLMPKMVHSYCDRAAKAQGALEYGNPERAGNNDAGESGAGGAGGAASQNSASS